MTTLLQLINVGDRQGECVRVHVYTCVFIFKNLQNLFLHAKDSEWNVFVCESVLVRDWLSLCMHVCVYSKCVSMGVCFDMWHVTYNVCGYMHEWMCVRVPVNVCVCLLRALLVLSTLHKASCIQKHLVGQGHAYQPTPKCRPVCFSFNCL